MSERHFGARVVLALMAAMLVFVSGCGDDTTSQPRSERSTAGATAQRSPTASGSVTNYVGKIEGTQSLVAVQLDGSTVNAYFCDSDEQWGFLEGTVSDGTISARGGDTALLAEADEGEITATITIDGEDHAASLEPASGEAGIFVEDTENGPDKTTSVWIRDNAGDVAGASFTVIAAKVVELAPLLQVQGSFTSEQQQLIMDILQTGVVPSPPPSADVPTGAQPLSFTTAVRCGIAAIKFRHAQASARRSFAFGSGVINGEELAAATEGLESACGLTQAMGCALTAPAQVCVTTR